MRQYRNERVVIGGVTALLDFFTAEALIRVGGGTVTVAGCNLVIERFDENEIVITGRIGGVTTNVVR